MSYNAKCNYTDTFGMVKYWETIIYNFLKEQKIQTPPQRLKTGNDKMKVYSGSQYDVVTSVGDYKLLTIVNDGQTSGSPTYTFCPSNGVASLACLRAEARTAFSSVSSCNNEEIDSVNGICNMPLASLSPSLSSQEAVRRNGATSP